MQGCNLGLSLAIESQTFLVSSLRLFVKHFELFRIKWPKWPKGWIVCLQTQTLLVSVSSLRLSNFQSWSRLRDSVFFSLGLVIETFSVSVLVIPVQWNRMVVSFIQGRLPSKVVFHPGSSSIQGHLPSKVIFYPRSSSIQGCLWSS